VGLPLLLRYRFALSSEPLTAAVLATDHDGFDYPLILEHARLIVDTKGKFRAPSVKVIKA